MAFNRLMLTTKGKTLSAKAQQGKKLHIARVGIGDGRLNGGSLVNRSGLIHQTLSLLIDAIQLTDEETVAAVIVTLDNAELAEGFYFRELGVFATDPDTGGEVLYLYDNADPDGEFIPDGQSGVLVFERLKLLISTSGIAEVTFSNSGNPIYLTHDMLGAVNGVAPLNADKKIPEEFISGGGGEAAVAAHDTSDDPHANMCFLRAVDGEAADPVPTDADTLEGHPAAYFQAAGAAVKIFGPVTVTAPVAGWTGSGPWTQTVTVAGVLASDNGLGVYAVDVADNAARKLYEKAYALLAAGAETVDGGVILTCRDGKPGVDLQIVVKGVR